MFYPLESLFWQINASNLEFEYELGSNKNLIFKMIFLKNNNKNLHAKDS
jgi:hypothetical protein